MRVITGSARGRRLKTLDGESVRPTYDTVKESMFSIIQFDIEGRRVIDLFSGSGQLGIEALSRGAKSAVFVDLSKESLDVTEENLETVGFRGLSKLVRSDAVDYLSRTDEVYDLAFLDPPYKAGIMTAALDMLFSQIADGGTVVCETSAEEVLDDCVDGFSCRRYKYGKTALTVYRRGVESG